MHVFLDAGMGNVLAFFELPTRPEDGPGSQHTGVGAAPGLRGRRLRCIARRQEAHIEAEGVDVIGPTNHGIFQSIYFFDPNGHRLELVANTQTQEQVDELKRVAPAYARRVEPHQEGAAPRSLAARARIHGGT